MKLRRKIPPFNYAEGELVAETDRSWHLRPVVYTLANGRKITKIHNNRGLLFRKITWEVDNTLTGD